MRYFSNTIYLRQRLPSIALLTITLFVYGCSNHNKPLPDKASVNVPNEWKVTIRERNQDVPQQKAVTKNTTETLKPKEDPPSKAVKNDWLSSFNDKSLDQHVATALDNNPDLLSSAANLKAAIEEVKISGSNLWPDVSANLRKDQRDNKTNNVTTTIRNVSASLDISWEADIWGRISESKKSALYNAQAQAELYKAAEFSLVANVSRAWYNLITTKLQLDLAHQRLDSFKGTADLIDENYKSGLRSALDVYLSRTDVQLQVSRLADTQFDYVQALRAFKTLLGEYPDDSLEFDAQLPAIPNDVSLGLPAELMTRRPDIKASQLQYQSQVATANAANRSRYPAITFSGSIGDSRERFNELFESNNMLVSLIAGVAQPVFNAGELKSREQQAVYRAESAYAELIKAILNAYEEVENSVSREQLLLDQHHAIKQAVDYAQGGLDLALDRYKSGIENYTTVLESQRRLFDSMQNELNIRNALLQNRINIHLALGGDFTNSSPKTE